MATEEERKEKDIVHVQLRKDLYDKLMIISIHRGLGNRNPNPVIEYLLGEELKRTQEYGINNIDTP